MFVCITFPLPLRPRYLICTAFSESVIYRYFLQRFYAIDIGNSLASQEQHSRRIEHPRFVVLRAKRYSDSVVLVCVRLSAVGGGVFCVSCRRWPVLSHPRHARHSMVQDVSSAAIRSPHPAYTFPSIGLSTPESQALITAVIQQHLSNRLTKIGMLINIYRHANKHAYFCKSITEMQLIYCRH